MLALGNQVARANRAHRDEAEAGNIFSGGEIGNGGGTTGEVADEVKLDVDALAAQTEGDARRDAGRAYGERAYGFAYGFAYGGAVPKKRSTKHRFALLSTLM